MCCVSFLGFPLSFFVFFCCSLFSTHQSKTQVTDRLGNFLGKRVVEKKEWRLQMLNVFEILRNNKIISDKMLRRERPWVESLGVFQRPLTLILLQKQRDTNGRRIVIQIGGVYTTLCQEKGILCKSIAIEMWGRAKGAAKASCGETVVQKGVFGESVSSLPPLEVLQDISGV